MALKKQVSPAIRIVRGERDASARATHLEAATRKFLVTTNERKQMSTKTNFKRIALVAVAALGLGVLSSVPSNAAIVVSPTVTTVNGTAFKTGSASASDSRTAGTVTVKFTSTIATDTVTLTVAQTGGPMTNRAFFFCGDTSTSFAATVTAIDNTVACASAAAGGNTLIGSDTAVVTAGVGFNSATFKVQMDSAIAARVAGTYTYDVTVVTYPAAAFIAAPPVTKSISIVVAAVAAEATTASPTYSTAFITSGSTPSTSAVTDDAVTAVATASDTQKASIYVVLKNASNVGVSESLTVTTTVGNVGLSTGTKGKSVVLPYTAGGTQVYVFADGGAGTATINVSSTSVTFASKTVVFYAKTPATIVASVINNTPTVGTGAYSNTAVAAVAKDTNGNIWAGSLYLYSSNTAAISNDGVTSTCTYMAANSRHECVVTGVAAGTASITVKDETSTVNATKTSNAVSLTVSSATPAKVVLAWNKASYAPGEKATLVVKVVDSTGKDVPANNWTSLLATGGISLSTASGNGSDTVTATGFQTYSLDHVLGTSTNGTSPVKAYTIYMPASGTLVATATGGSALPLAGQVAVSATATVTDSGSAALAAVTALATTVASLKTLITTLTNLVLKIQKKVKA